LKSSLSLGILLLVAVAVPARPEWILLRTPQLELFTDAGEKAASRTLDRMAAVRQVLGQGPAAGRPLRVFLFASEREFHSYADGPLTGGTFHSEAERDYIILPAGSGLTQTAAHEYAHRVLNHSAPRFPLWLDEGLADLYSTLEVKGQTAVVGLAIEAHVAKLQSRSWLTARELENIGTNPALLNEREHAGIFYAQSWGLVHMLKLGTKWREQTPRFLDALLAGRDPLQAFHEVYGRTLDQAIEELHNYVPRLRSERMETGLRLPQDTPTAIRLEALESTLQLADLALHEEKLALARRLFEEAAMNHPSTPEAEAGLGTLAMAENRRPEALVHLRRATELRAPGGEIYFQLAMLRRDDGAPAEEIDQLLERAISADPSYADAHLLLGQRETDRGDYVSAIGHLKAAAGIVPRSSNAWYGLAYAQSKIGEKDGARDSARRALQTARTREDEDMARVLLESLE
jgi:tetratricopeptide (TPR) repeat protein